MIVMVYSCVQTNTWCVIVRSTNMSMLVPTYVPFREGTYSGDARIIPWGGSSAPAIDPSGNKRALPISLANYKKKKMAFLWRTVIRQHETQPLPIYSLTDGIIPILTPTKYKHPINFRIHKTNQTSVPVPPTRAPKKKYVHSYLVKYTYGSQTRRTLPSSYPVSLLHSIPLHSPPPPLPLSLFPHGAPFLRVPTYLPTYLTLPPCRKQQQQQHSNQKRQT